jgi:hypothetical protein
VLIVERWLLGRLRRRIFYSLAELNAAIVEMLQKLNDERAIRRLGVTRRQLLEEVDRPALKPLPVEPYEFAQWKTCRVGVDYHVEIAIGPLARHGETAEFGVTETDRFDARDRSDFQNNEMLAAKRMEGVGNFGRAQRLTGAKCSSM